ncbi:MAG: hypothetical protein ACE5FW_02260 [Candidatus Aenigmatarchaeota archaeon]
MDSEEPRDPDFYRASRARVPSEIIKTLKKNPRELEHAERVLRNFIRIRLRSGEFRDSNDFAYQNEEGIIAAVAHDANKAKEGYVESDDPEYRREEVRRNAEAMADTVRGANSYAVGNEVGFLIRYHHELGEHSDEVLCDLQRADLIDFFAEKLLDVLEREGYEEARGVLKRTYGSGSETSKEFARATLAEYEDMVYNGNAELRELIQKVVFGRPEAQESRAYSPASE